MLRFVVRRVATSILLLVATSALVFFVLRLLPGDPVITSLGASPGVSPETIDRLRHEAGIDRPIVTQYLSWVSAALHGDLGKSYFSQYPVSSLIRNRLAATVELAFLGVFFSVALRRPGCALGGPAPEGHRRYRTGRILDGHPLAARVHRRHLPDVLSRGPGRLAADARLCAVRRQPERQPQALRAPGPHPGARRSAAAVPVPARLTARADERVVRPHRPRQGDDRAPRRPAGTRFGTPSGRS